MDTNKKWTNITLTVAVVALVLSLYTVISSAQFYAEDNFNAKVEEGIDAYVKKQQEAAMAAQAPAPTEPVEVSIDDDAVKGDKNAPVTIVEFSEYQCPYCKRYVDQTFVQIKENYIDTGKVKYVFRDFPLGFHEHAKNAAIAAECAREQGGDDMYWEYHDVLFENSPNLAVDQLKQYATDLGLSTSKFNSCLDNEEYADEVDADMKEGSGYGVRGTPGFFINGRLISGAQPYESFEKIIEEELSK